MTTPAVPASIKACVIGHPVAHSKSPLIHRHWIESYGLSGTYEAVDVSPESLESGIRDLVRKGYAGFNVTIPHKQAVMALCDRLDETARAVGAVNTVVIEQDGSLSGKNTDVFGFVENVRQSVPSVNFRKGPALVLGAGGAARAIVHGLLREGVPEVRLVNRTLSKAEDLALDFPVRVPIRVIDWEHRASALEDLSLLVNATSLGMTGQPPLDLPLEGLPKTCLVSDIVYAPLMTDLLTQASGHGNPVVTGIGMLLHQARPAFETWFGVLPDVTEELVKKATEPYRKS